MTTQTTVSPRAEQALHAAMTRLFAGTPQHTDGQLTKNNLWREAGVSRATINRATTLLAEWDTQIGHSPAQAREHEHAQHLAELRGKLTTSQHSCQRLQEQVDAAATVITILAAENAALRDQLTRRSANVIPFTRALTVQE